MPIPATWPGPLRSLAAVVGAERVMEAALGSVGFPADWIETSGEIEAVRDWLQTNANP